MKTAVLLILTVAFAIGAFYLIWMNRASEKTFSAVIALWLGLAAVLIFGGQSDLSERFPVSFFVYQTRKAPARIPFRTDLRDYFLIAKLQKESPTLIHDDDNGQTFYHEFLQKAIIDALSFRYSGSWDVDVVRYRTSSTMQTTYPGTNTKGHRLTVPDLERIMEGNRFAKQHLMPLELVLPPNGTLTVIPPRKNKQGLQQGLIELSTPFVTVTIKTRPLWWGVGLGEYRMMTDLPVGKDQELFGGYNYEMQVSAKFNRLRAGHPDMPLYRKWASQIISELKEDFDEELILKNAKEQFLFTKQAVHFGAQELPEPLMGYSPPQDQSK